MRTCEGPARICVQRAVPHALAFEPYDFSAYTYALPSSQKSLKLYNLRQVMPALLVRVV